MTEKQDASPLSRDNLTNLARKYQIRVFSSDEKKYNDRSGNQQVSQLFISQEGLPFVRSLPHILTTIQHWLENGDINVFEDIGEFAYLNGGSQSKVFKLTLTSGESVVFKIRNSVSDPDEPSKDLNQPYLNEMIQVRILAEELTEELKVLKIKPPEFLFATSDVSCTKFVAGNHPADTDENRQKIEKLQEIVSRFLLSKIDNQQESSVWKNITYDLTDSSAREKKFKFDNFIETKDGDWVWIDPFFYHFKPQLSSFFRKRTNSYQDS